MKIFFYEEIKLHSDGTTSAEANPTHVYGEKGTYMVELTVEDSRGKESKEQTKVTVKQDPQTGGSLEAERDSQ
nr:PKD domain-containing protein [Bacillus cereus]